MTLLCAFSYTPPPSFLIAPIYKYAIAIKTRTRTHTHTHTSTRVDRAIPRKTTSASETHSMRFPRGPDTRTATDAAALSFVKRCAHPPETAGFSLAPLYTTYVCVRMPRPLYLSARLAPFFREPTQARGRKRTPTIERQLRATVITYSLVVLFQQFVRTRLMLRACVCVFLRMSMPRCH